MGVPSIQQRRQQQQKQLNSQSEKHNNKHTTNQYECKNLVLIAILAIIVIINIGDVSAFDSYANEQHEFHKELERLQKQIKPQTYNLQDRRPSFQMPQFNPNGYVTNRESHFGVQQQEQRQEQHHHHHQRILEIENTKYSLWPHNMTYLSSTGYNALGMTQLYNLTNTIIDLFVDEKEPIPPGENDFSSFFFNSPSTHIFSVE